MFLAVPFATGDFGVTSLYQTLRKAFVTLLLTGVAPLVYFGGSVSFLFALILVTLGLKYAFTNLDYILNSAILPKI